MKTKMFFIFFASLVFASGCATKNTASNHDILAAITKQSEAITNLASAIRSPVSTSEREENAPAKESESGFGYALTATDLRPSNSGKKTETNRSPLFSKKNPSTTDSEKKLEGFEKRVFKLEEIVGRHKHRLDSLEKFDRKLAWEISQVGIDNFPGINVGKFAKGTAKVSSEIESQIQAVAKRYNSAIGNRTDTLTIVVTGYDDGGNISEKRGNAAAKVLKKFLNKNFNITIASSPSGNYPSKVSISNPFITAN